VQACCPQPCETGFGSNRNAGSTNPFALSVFRLNPFRLFLFSDLLGCFSSECSERLVKTPCPLCLCERLFLTRFAQGTRRKTVGCGPFLCERSTLSPPLAKRIEDGEGFTKSWTAKRFLRPGGSADLSWSLGFAMNGRYESQRSNIKLDPRGIA
jgi:hypothetical protein